MCSSQIALYSFPVLWFLLLLLAIFKLNLSYAPTSTPCCHADGIQLHPNRAETLGRFACCSLLSQVILALVFNLTNVIGFTYAYVSRSATLRSNRNGLQRPRREAEVGVGHGRRGLGLWRYRRSTHRRRRQERHDPCLWILRPSRSIAARSLLRYLT